jgi:hypothetical protein
MKRQRSFESDGNDGTEDTQPNKLIKVDSSSDNVNDKPCKHTRNHSKKKIIDDDTHLVASALQDLECSTVKSESDTSETWTPKENDIVKILWNLSVHESKWFVGTVICIMTNGKYIVKYEDGEICENEFILKEWKLIERPTCDEECVVKTKVCNFCESLNTLPKVDTHHDQNTCKIYKQTILDKKAELENQIETIRSEIDKITSMQHNLLNGNTAQNVENNINGLQTQLNNIEVLKNKAIEEYRTKMDNLKNQFGIITKKIDDLNEIFDKNKTFDEQISEQENKKLPLRKQIEKLDIKLQLFQLEEEKAKLMEKEENL